FVLAVIVHGTDRAGASSRSAKWDVRRQICGVLRCSLLCPSRAWTLTGRFFGIAPGYGYVNTGLQRALFAGELLYSLQRRLQTCPRFRRSRVSAERLCGSRSAVGRAASAM